MNYHISHCVSPTLLDTFIHRTVVFFFALTQSHWRHWKIPLCHFIVFFCQLETLLTEGIKGNGGKRRKILCPCRFFVFSHASNSTPCQSWVSVCYCEIFQWHLLVATSIFSFFLFTIMTKKCKVLLGFPWNLVRLCSPHDLSNNFGHPFAQFWFTYQQCSFIQSVVLNMSCSNGWGLFNCTQPLRYDCRFLPLVNGCRRNNVMYLRYTSQMAFSFLRSGILTGLVNHSVMVPAVRRSCTGSQLWRSHPVVITLSLIVASLCCRIHWAETSETHSRCHRAVASDLQT